MIEITFLPDAFKAEEMEKFNAATPNEIDKMAQGAAHESKVANESYVLFKKDDDAYSTQKQNDIDTYKKEHEEELKKSSEYKNIKDAYKEEWLKKQLAYDMTIYNLQYPIIHPAPSADDEKYHTQADANIRMQYEEQRNAQREATVTSYANSHYLQQQNEINRQKNDIDRALREELARLDKIVADQRNVHTQSGLDYNTELEKLVIARDTAWAAYYSAEGKKQADDKVMAYKIESIRKDAEADYVKKNTNKNKTEAEARKDFEKYWDEEGKEKARTVAVSRRLQELTDYNAKTINRLLERVKAKEQAEWNDRWRSFSWSNFTLKGDDDD